MRSLFFLLAFVVSYSIFAQSPDVKFRHLTVEQGLSSNQIKCLHTDKEGFIWVGTRYGLNRFDGNKFKIYKNLAEDSTSIPDNFIWHIHEATDGKLWFGTGNGLGILDKKTNHFTNYFHQENNPNSLIDNDVREIVEDKNGVFWIGTTKGLHRFDSQTGTFTRFQMPNPEKENEENPICGMWIDHQGILWVCAIYGFFDFDREKKIFNYHPQYNYREGRNNFYDVYEDSEHYLWLSTNGGGIYRIAPDRKTYEHYLPDPKNPYSILGNEANQFREDSKGKVWILHGDLGVSVFDKKTKQFIVHQYDEKNPHSLSGSRTCGFTEDKNGNIWIGTYQNGLNYFDNLFGGKTAFQTFQHNPLYPERLRQGSINTMYEDSEGLLWIGVEFKGIDVYNLKTDSYMHYSQDIKNPYGLKENNFYVFTEDKHKNIWIGDWHRTSYFDKREKRFVHDLPNVSFIFNHSSYHILKDREQKLWFSFHNKGFGVFWQDSLKSNGERGVTQFWRKINENDLLADVAPFIQDRNSVFWFGDAEKEVGVVSFDPLTEKFATHKQEVKNTYSVVNNEILALADDKIEDWLWIGTRKGLNVMDKKSKCFLLLDEQNGLHDDIIYAIVTDSKGNIWLAAPKGIARLSFNRKKLADYFSSIQVNTPFKKYEFGKKIETQIRVFDYGDGAITIDNQSLSNSFYQNKNGYIYFGGSKGFCKFHPDSIQENRTAPPVVFTSFKLFEKEYSLDTAITYKRHLTLTHDQNFLSFEFAALNFIRPDKNQYAYKIEGLNSDWIPLGNKNTISIAGLEPDTYILRVKASNNDGLWNEQGASIRITILPPWWATWWFISLIISVIAGIIYGIYRYRVKEIRKEEAHKQEKEKIKQENEKTKEAYSILQTDFQEISQRYDASRIDTHFLGNCMTLIGDNVKN